MDDPSTYSSLMSEQARDDGHAHPIIELTPDVSCLFTRHNAPSANNLGLSSAMNLR